MDELAEKIAGEDPSSRIQTESDSASYSFGNIISDIEAIVKRNNARCVVIDSISLLKLMLVPVRKIYLYGKECRYVKPAQV